MAIIRRVVLKTGRGLEREAGASPRPGCGALTLAASCDAVNHFDFILDTVSAKHDLTSALGWLKRQGTLIMVGASDQPLDLAVFPLIFNRRKIMGSLIGGLPETQEMLDHCGKHNITSDIELIEPNAINQAYERVLKSDVKYRFVIDCQKF